MLRLRFALIGLIIVMLSSTFAYAEVYKTVDKNGRVTFSDTPPPNTNAKPIELKSINTTPPPAIVPTDVPTAINSDTQGYAVQITAPENGATLLANERSISVFISLNQDLQNGDVFAYKLDGNIIAKTKEFSFTINEPPRGEHSLTVDVVDIEGNSLAQSNAITVVIMRPPPKQTATPMPRK